MGEEQGTPDDAVQKAREQATSNTDLGQDQVQQKVDEAAEQGFFGTAADPTPRENYSLQTPPDAPTPETDKGAAEEVVKTTGDATSLRRHQAEYIAGNAPKESSSQQQGPSTPPPPAGPRRRA